MMRSYRPEGTITLSPGAISGTLTRSLCSYAQLEPILMFRVVTLDKVKPFSHTERHSPKSTINQATLVALQFRNNGRSSFYLLGFSMVLRLRRK